MQEEPVAGQDTHLQGLIDGGVNGDARANEVLINHACDRLLRLTRQMFHSYPKLRRWESTDDVFQNAMVRLHRALKDVRVESVRHFFNLAALQIRRELNNLVRHYYGPEGLAANYHTDGIPADDLGGTLYNGTEQPQDLSQWAEFHAFVDKLPLEEQEVVNLLYYEDLTQEEAAKVLEVSPRTIKRWWQAIRLKLYEEFKRDRKGSG